MVKPKLDETKIQKTTIIEKTNGIKNSVTNGKADSSQSNKKPIQNKPLTPKNKKKTDQKKNQSTPETNIERWMRHKVPTLLYFQKFHIFNTNSIITARNLLSSMVTLIGQTERTFFCLVCQTQLKFNMQLIYEHWRSDEHNAELVRKQNNVYWKQSPGCPIMEIDLAMNFIQKQWDRNEKVTFVCQACEIHLGTHHLDKNVYEAHIQDRKHHLQKSILKRRCNKLHNSIVWCHTPSIYNIILYSCQICQKTFNSEEMFANHLENQKHISKLQQNPDVFLDGCTHCGWWWLSNNQAYAQHCLNKKHKNANGTLFYLPKQLTRMIVKHFENDGQKNIEYESNNEEVQKILKSLKSVVLPSFPWAKTYAFGSRESGLGLPNSDIDVFLDCCNIYKTGLDNETIVKNLNEVWRLLGTHKKEWSRIRKIEKSRTPIITAMHISTGIKCDISFGNGLSVENTKLVRIYVNAFPMLRKIILFMKDWLKICDLHGSHIIKSYAITWFVIFYLQSMTILPSVEKLTLMKNEPNTVYGWETGVTESIPPIECDLTFHELVTGMLVFYAEFDFLYNVACPLTGNIVPKIYFTQLENLPVCMRNYKNYVQTCPKPEYFRIDSIMCIQDPYDLSHNLTKAVGRFDVFRFQYFCMKTCEILIELV